MSEQTLSAIERAIGLARTLFRGDAPVVLLWPLGEARLGLLPIRTEDRADMALGALAREGYCEGFFDALALASPPWQP